jgi:hypothetical protein
MSKIVSTRIQRVPSDNLKSKTCTEPRRSIENLKWVGIVAIALTFVFGGAVGQVQQPGKIFRIGFLDSSTASSSTLLVDGFRQELIKLGWIEEKKYHG